MYYRRCESCGSKALATATRCPRCESAFELNDQHGKRHRLVPCRTCKVVQPADITSCRWCGSVRTSRTAIRPRSAAIVAGAVAATALLVASRGSIIPAMQSSFSTMSANAAEVFAATPVPEARDIVAAPVRRATPPSVATIAIPAVVTDGGVSADSVANAPVTQALSADDVVESWEEAKAITWVNVRSDRSRDATILAIVNPDEIVRLGARASGWRQVNIDGATGWVDARHFALSRQ